jgi:plastocyanin
MRIRNLFVLSAAAAFALCAWGQSVTGSISITKKLTKRNVTPDVSVYQRGTAVGLGKDAQEDPLAFERSRVVLYLEGPGPAGAGPTPQIAQLDRRFVPDLVVIPAGSAVSFPNMDPIFHNVFSLSKAKSFDLGSYDKGDTRRVVFPKPGIVEVYCHLHPNMAATIVITPNRWYARVDASGQYHIDDVPPGTYTLVAWHKAAGFFRKTIVVGPGHDAVANFVIPIVGDAKMPASDTEGGQAQ